MADSSGRVTNTQILARLETITELFNQRFTHQDTEIKILCESVGKALNERRAMENKITGHEERIKVNKENIDNACDDIDDLKKKSYIWNGINTIFVGVTAAVAAIFGR